MLKEKLINEINNMPDDKALELLEFIKFLKFRSEQNILAKSFQKLSEPVFAKYWDNEEDSVYDTI